MNEKKLRTEKFVRIDVQVIVDTYTYEENEEVFDYKCKEVYDMDYLLLDEKEKESQDEDMEKDKEKPEALVMKESKDEDEDSAEVIPNDGEGKEAQARVAFEISQILRSEVSV